MNTILSFTPSLRSQIIAGAFVLLAVIAIIWAPDAAPERIWPNLLLNGFYLISLAVSAIFFIATQRVTGARWSSNLRRIPEAFMMALPIASILLLPLFFGREHLFPWAHVGARIDASAIAGHFQYLQARWFLARMLTALVLWNAFAWLIRRTSLAQDRSPGQNLVLHQRLTRYAVLFVPVFAITFTWSAFDWLISLDPTWFSTMFAVYVFAGTFVQGIAAVTFATVMLKESSALGGVIGERHLHDLGKMLFAFSTFWAYIWTSQYLLIWYGNIPEEITHFIPRTNGPWLYLFALNVILNWVVPFTVLLSAGAKHSARILKAISLVLLVGHWLDLYILIMPSQWSAPKFGFLELAVAAGYLGLLYLLFVRSLVRAPLVPVNDPVVQYENLNRSPAFAHGLTGVKQ